MNKKIFESISNVFSQNLKATKGERILVFTDNYNKELKTISSLFKNIGTEYTENIYLETYMTTGRHGTEPPENVWEKAFGINAFKELKKNKLLKPLLAKKILEDKIEKAEKIIRKYKKEAVDAIIALPYFSTSHTKFRDLLTRICGTRYASMPLFDKKMLSGAMKVDLKKMLKRTEMIRKAVDKCSTLEIESQNGTLIKLSKKGRKTHTDTGLLDRPGSFSNLPAGEVFFAPLEGTANGTLILEWAPTRRLKSPLKLRIENGYVAKVEGREKYADVLRKILDENEKNRNIAEVGIGTNDRAKRPDNILESEKILGTIHIALGDNSSFGGRTRTSFHQDFIFFKPAVTLICNKGKRKALIKKGKVVSNL